MQSDPSLQAQVTIESDGDGTKYRFPWIHRRGFQRNGMAAFVCGSVPCVVLGLGVPAAMHWLVGDQLHHDGNVESLVDLIASWLVPVFLAFWLTLSGAFAVLFTGVTILTITRGGKAWASIRGSAMWVGAFFGGELQLDHVTLRNVRDISLERSDESDIVERGHIRLTTDDRDIHLAQGYPLDQLRPVYEDLKRRIADATPG